MQIRETSKWRLHTEYADADMAYACERIRAKGDAAWNLGYWGGISNVYLTPLSKDIDIVYIPQVPT